MKMVDLFLENKAVGNTVANAPGVLIPVLGVFLRNCKLLLLSFGCIYMPVIDLSLSLSLSLSLIAGVFLRNRFGGSFLPLFALVGGFQVFTGLMYVLDACLRLHVHASD